MNDAPISDVASLIDRLDGLAAAAKFFGESKQAVCNWRLRGRLPGRLAHKHQALLSARGINAPLCLWRVEAPEEAA